ncbi:unnamed protein product [Rhizophagus irregularis]|nr:unnamed protein product [Rhizophagus irregularis]
MTEFSNKICQALRPRFKRINIDNKTELQKQIKEAEEINNSLSTTSSILFANLSYKTQTEAIFTSGCLILITFPELKNSNDYYNEQNDNLISEIFSESLQIDLSQLKVMKFNKDGKSKHILNSGFLLVYLIKNSILR